MPRITYKSPGGKTRVVKTAYTKAGKKKAKQLAKKLGGKVAYATPKKKPKGKRGKRV